MYARSRRRRYPETVHLYANPMLHVHETCRSYLRHAAWMGSPAVVGIQGLEFRGPVGRDGWFSLAVPRDWGVHAYAGGLKAAVFPNELHESVFRKSIRQRNIPPGLGTSHSGPHPYKASEGKGGFR